MPRLNALGRLLKNPYGLRAKPLLRWGLSRVMTSAGMIVSHGGQALDPGKPTVIVASHEASTTGAPILALNLAQQLSKTHNVITILVKGGALREAFQACSISLIQTRRSFVNRKLMRRALQRANCGQSIGFALVNSVVSSTLLEPLRSEGIACLSLMHEFVTYIKPLDIFAELGLWSSRVVCSTPLTWNDVLRHCSYLSDVPTTILPQGKCTPPSIADQGRVASSAHTFQPQDLDTGQVFLDQLPKDTLLVLGAGAVQPRKGVDLFVAAAQQIQQQAGDLNIRFAWIGSGYDPNHDLNVSIWVKDQIERSGLSKKLLMLDASPAYNALIQRSDLFLVSSRLDPLPNVAIDAMLEATPVLCFAEACGLANLLEEQPELHQACVAPYFDIQALAKKALALLRSPSALQRISKLSREQAQRWFHMPSYVQSLVKLGLVANKEVRQENEDIERVLNAELIDRDFHSTATNLSDLALTQRYSLAWRSNLGIRKPFPGFHPGIYREQQRPAIGHHDPLAHWHKQGQPQGPWQVPIIQPAIPMDSIPMDAEVALHIHVFYPELLAPILQRLGCNKLRPDLFVTYSNAEIENSIKSVLAEMGWTAKLHTVPNRGRDIGPLLTELGLQLDRDYLIHGHLHTKKSVLIDGGVASRWREFLLMNLLGDARKPMLDRIASLLIRDSDLGMVFLDDPGCLGWSANRAEAERLALKLDIKNLPEAINFPVGTMFWARQGALQPLYKLGLNWNDYPDEPLGYDGTMLHAIERLLPQICKKQGFRYAMTHVPGFTR